MIAPPAISFAATTIGTAAAAQSVLLTSSGMATLHISSVQLGGSNASDFAMTNGCTGGSYPANSTCTREHRMCRRPDVQTVGDRNAHSDSYDQ
jgi:hypothetical protein